MYLAMTSTSRLTLSPGCLTPRVVRRRVSGIRQTVSDPEEPVLSETSTVPATSAALMTSATSTTVSYTPSMAMEPLTAT